MRKIYLETTVAFILTFCLSAIDAQTYTLTNDDVVMEEGVLVSCSYNYSIKDILIPDVLDGQKVERIGEKAFYMKEINSVALPKTIIHIGKNSFYGNNLRVFDVSGYSSLLIIDNSAFSGNQIERIDLSDCVNLITVGWQSFYSNNLQQLNISGCKALSSIGENAFSDHHLTKLDLSDCKSLIEIKAEAFNGDKLENYKLPKPSIEEKTFKYWSDLNGKQYKAGAKVTVLWMGFTAVFK